MNTVYGKVNTVYGKVNTVYGKVCQTRYTPQCNTNYITKSAPSKMRRNIGRDTRRSISKMRRNIGRDTRRSILRQGQEHRTGYKKEYSKTGSGTGLQHNKGESVVRT